MRTKLFNLTTMAVGVYSMVNHVLTAGSEASLATLAVIWAATSIVSLAGTVAIVNYKTNKQNEFEAQMVAAMKNARK